jgi:phage repressor protein C with HTH and peptisase S24 domain
MIVNTVVDRLKSAMAKQGVSKAELARAAGVTPQAVTRWFKNGSISKESLDACAKRLNVTIDWLMRGQQKSNTPDSNAEYLGAIEPWDSKTPLDIDEVEVPFYMEVELSAGNGSVIQLETNGPKLRFSKSTLKRQGVSIDHAACVRVSGNSMEPVIPDGATVGVDTAYTNIVDGEMYAIDWAGELYVKVLMRRPGGGIRIRSFNVDEYPDENLSPEEAQSVRVIGRVFWYSVLR